MTARGLPVLTDCEDCAHMKWTAEADRWHCAHDKAPVGNTLELVEDGKLPPDWCPLRTAERSYTRAEVLAFGERVRDATAVYIEASPTIPTRIAGKRIIVADLLDAPERGGGR